jgi:NNP family nitrate/nitrite transporter-like MFS transporter
MVRQESIGRIKPDDMRINVGMTLILSGAVFLNLLVRTVFSPLLLVIEGDLGISHKEATQFFLLISTGYSAGMLCSGYVSPKVTHRGTIVLALSTGGACLLCISFLHSLHLIRIFLLLLGGGLGLYLPSGLATIREMTGERNLGKAFSIHEIGPNLSLILAPIYAQVFIANASWRLGLTMLGGTCMLYSAVLFVLLRGFGGTGQGVTLKNLKSILLSGRFWIMVLFFCLAIGATLGVYSVLPTYLVVERGMPLRTVNAYIGISRISGIGAIFLIGLLTDRFGVKRVLFFVLALSGVTTALLGVPVRRVLLGSLFLQPIIIECFFPVALTQTAAMWSKTSYNIAISLVIPFSLLIGGGVFPMLMGLLGEQGNFALGFWLLGAIIAGCAGIVFALKDEGG